MCYFFVTLFVLSLCPFDISVGVGAFVIGLGQISSFCLEEFMWRHIDVHYEMSMALGAQR